MKVQKLVPIVVVATVASLSASALRGQNLSVFGMGSISSLYNNQNFLEHSIPYDSSYKTGGGVTFGAEFGLNRILGVEGSYSRVRNNLSLANLGVSPAAQTGYGIHNQRISGDLVAHAPMSLLGPKPYLAGGLEFDHFAEAGTASNVFAGFLNAPFGAANKVGVNYGGGVDWGFLPHVALRVDVRDHLTSSPTFGFPSSSSIGPYFPISGAAHNVEYSAGIVLRLGK